MSYDKSLTGALFKNEQKRDGKQDADYRGQCELHGEAYWIDAWINESKKDGKKYLSLRFKPKSEQGMKKELEKMPATPTPKAFNDDIPF